MKFLNKFGTAALASAVCIGAFSGPAMASESTNYNIDVIFKTTSNEYTKYLMAGAQAAAEEFGVSVDLKGATSETAYDEQQNMIETDLNSGSYDAMVIIPLQGDMVQTMVSGTDIPIFSLDTDFEADEKVSYIGVSQTESAKKGAEYAVDMAKEAGWDEITAICIAGVQGDATAEGRKTGYQEGIEEAGGTFLADETQYSDAVADKAVVAMEGIMQNHPEGVSIIVCHNDDCAMAAARAAKGNEAYENTIFVGFDGISSACQSIIDGVETMTVSQDGYGQGYACVKAAVDYLNGEEVETSIICDSQIITQANAQERLDELNEQLAGLDETEATTEEAAKE